MSLTDPGPLGEPTADERALMQALFACVQSSPSRGVDASALALRALLADRPALDPGLMTAVWRRIEAARAPTALIVSGQGALRYLGASGHDHPTLVDDPDRALAQCTGMARALIALDGRAWWSRLLARRDLRVIGAFPESGYRRPEALMLGAAPTGPTGEDRTFWVTEADQSDGDILKALAAAGLSGQRIDEGAGLKLFALAGYVEAHDIRLQSAPLHRANRLSGVIGAAPRF